MSEMPISVRALGVSFGRAEILRDVCFDVSPGEVVGLVGPNGCGKSTTLRTVTGLLRPTAGSVQVLGHPAGSHSARSAVGFVPDDPSGVDLLTIDEFTSLVGRLWRNPAGFEHRVDALLDVFALSERRSQTMGSLSNGQRRIVSIVAAASLVRPVWVVDEATAALDPEAVVMLRELVRHAAGEGTAVLYATQDLAFAESCADRTVLLSAGQVIDDGTPTELMTAHRATSLEGAFMSAMFGNERLGEVRRVLETL